MKIEVLSDQPVSTNLLQKDRAITCAHPQTVARRDGSVVCLYRQGRQKHSHDGILVAQTSSDKGASWSQPQVVFDGQRLEPTKTVVSGGICETADGTLLATFGLAIGLRPGVYLFGEDGMKLRRQVCAVRSEDGGTTWSELVVIDTDAFARAGITTKPFVLPNGELCAPLEVKMEWGPNGTAAAFSGDGGRSFTPPALFAADREGRVSLADAHFATLRGGRLLMLLWVFRHDDETTIATRRSFSENHGRTWTEPEPVGMLGQVIVPLALSSGPVLAVSTYRRPPQGIYLWISRDGGVSWETDHPLQLWNPDQGRITGERVSVGDQESGGDQVWQALAGFTFGTPDLVVLDDGSLLLTYYATLDGVIHVRACRFELNDAAH